VNDDELVGKTEFYLEARATMIDTVTTVLMDRLPTALLTAGHTLPSTIVDELLAVMLPPEP